MTENFHEKLLDSLFDGVYFVDNQKKIIFWNTSAENITGYTKDEVMGSSCSDNILRHINDKGTELCIHGCPLGRTLVDGFVREAEVYLHHKEGHRVPVHIRISPVKNDKDEIVGASELFSNNSHQADILKELESLKNEVLVDALTQVGNRKFCELNLLNRLNEFKTNKIQFGLLFLDIDYFKKFNDNYGHSVGDKVLKMVSKTIFNILRGMDIVCRWGGEEFIIIAPNVDTLTLTKIAEKVRTFVEKSWLTIENKNLSVTVSIGGTMATSDDTSESLIKRADKLMYLSKQSGRNCVTIK